MSVQAAMAKIEKARKQLIADWDHTHAIWRDNMARDFQTDYIEPAEADLRQAVSAMEQLAAALARARRDCE